MVFSCVYHITNTRKTQYIFCLLPLIFSSIYGLLRRFSARISHPLHGSRIGMPCCPRFGRCCCRWVSFQFSGILLPLLSISAASDPRAGSSAPLIGSGISLPCPAPLQVVPVMLSRLSDRFPLEFCPGSLCLLEMCAGSSPDRSALIGSPCSSPGSLCRGSLSLAGGSVSAPVVLLEVGAALFAPFLISPRFSFRLSVCRSVSLSRDPAACSPFCPSVGAWGLFCTVNIALHPNTSRQILSI